jgi:hypothetical protein
MIWTGIAKFRVQTTEILSSGSFRRTSLSSGFKISLFLFFSSGLANCDTSQRRCLGEFVGLATWAYLYLGDLALASKTVWF